MMAIRVGAFLLLAAMASAQTTYTKTDEPSPNEPKLPVVDSKACPGPSRRVDGVTEPVAVRIQKTEPMYSTWEEKRTAVATLKVGEEVKVWAGVNVVREPNKARVLQPSEPDEKPVLKPGDEILNYGFRGDGNYVFWAQGVWFTEYYENEGDLKGACGFADKSLCTFAFFKKGVQEWWVQVKTNSGVTGWVLASKQTRDKTWSDANFGDLCMMD